MLVSEAMEDSCQEFAMREVPLPQPKSCDDLRTAAR